MMFAQVPSVALADVKYLRWEEGDDAVAACTRLIESGSAGAMRSTCTTTIVAACTNRSETAPITIAPLTTYRRNPSGC
jgi:hypothetical protein